MNAKIIHLTETAKKRMKRSQDPIHDLAHVSRVVSYSRRIAKDMTLTEKQLDALLLAAWWHDAARTLTKQPSFIWAVFLDDMVSSMMLWWATLRCKLFGGVVGLSTKVILCKSLGTGALFTRLLLGKKDRVLVDILSDADKLDMLTTERTKQIHLFVNNSALYKMSYKLAIWWWFQCGHMKLRTKQAKKFIKELLANFIGFMKQPEIQLWHINHFGEAWLQRFLTRLDNFYQYVGSPPYQTS